jgi:hypothetical protein
MRSVRFGIGSDWEESCDVKSERELHNAKDDVRALAMASRTKHAAALRICTSFMHVNLKTEAPKRQRSEPQTPPVWSLGVRH